MKEKFEEVIKHYHFKNDSGWDYYYKSHSFITYLGAVKLSHFHQIKISDNERLESGITRSYGTTQIPPEIEKYKEIEEERFNEAYERVLKFMNEWKEYA